MLKTIFNTKSPYAYIIFAFLLFMMTLQDKMQSGKFFGVNGILLSYNMILYLCLLHIVFIFSVTKRPKKYVNLYGQALKSSGVGYEMKVRKQSLSDNQITEKESSVLFAKGISVFVAILMIYGLMYLSGTMKLTQPDKSVLWKMTLMITATVFSELFLVQHILQTPITTPCVALRSAMTPGKSYHE